MVRIVHGVELRPLLVSEEIYPRFWNKVTHHQIRYWAERIFWHMCLVANFYLKGKKILTRIYRCARLALRVN